MCILLEHANRKVLLTSTNNGAKTLAVTVSKRETRCCINMLYYRYHDIRNIYQKIYKLRKDVIVRGKDIEYHDICSITYTYIYIIFLLRFYTLHKTGH